MKKVKNSNVSTYQPLSVSTTSPWLDRWYIQTLFLIGGVILTYGHTFDVPFYLDDFSSIQENPVIYNWQGTLAELWQFAALRIVGYLSFAWNYQIHQFQVGGYHLVNILIHLLTGCAAWGLLRGLVRTPVLEGTLSVESKRWLPLLVALIIILHPLQIQAVTYVVQRLASLAALFYIAAMACFIQARLSTNWRFQFLWSLACLLLMLLAFFTKQNTFTLPLALFLLEYIFFAKPVKRLWLVTASSIVLTSIIILTMIGYNQSLFAAATWQHWWEMLQQVTRETTEISRLSYFATQMTVLWLYINLFFWPPSSHIDYDYPITDSLIYVNENYHLIARILHSEALWALAGHLILIGIALYSLRRLPLLAFGILFYYLAHTIESSIFPIRDVIFEHRAYLPNLGLATVCAWLLIVQLPRWLKFRVAATITISLLLTLGIATWLRNQMWRDPIALWQHNVTQAPLKQRGWIILGKHLVQVGKPAEGIEALNHAITTNHYPDGTQSLSVTPETALNLIVAYKKLGQYDKALEWVNHALALKSKLRPFDHAKFLVNQGNIYYEIGRTYQQQGQSTEAKTFYQQSENSYRQALQIYPQNLNAQINLASILGMLGHIDEAINIYQEVLKIEPSNSYVQQSLQKLQELQ
jgi:tetratricopeptide (TPR) repeat protein